MCEETIRQKSAKELAAELVRFDSVSSKSNSEVTQTVSGWLDQLGFQIEWLEYKDSQGTTKVSIVAKREPKAGVKGPEGNATGGGAYLAHTDVVPVDDWDTGFSGPFEPIEREGRLYGRGSCDMKGSLACAIQAVSRIDRNQQIKPLYFVVTADEEIGMEGAYRVDKQSKLFQEMIDSRVTGIIGEPTEMKVVVAHKGTWEVVLRANGTSAHKIGRAHV